MKHTLLFDPGPHLLLVVGQTRVGFVYRDMKRTLLFDPGSHLLLVVR